MNAVDEIIQFQGVVTLKRIREEFILPALKQILTIFTFHIQGFLADNGGKYFSYTVAELLENYGLNTPTHVHGTPMIMDWLKVKMAL